MHHTYFVKMEHYLDTYGKPEELDTWKRFLDFSEEN